MAFQNHFTLFALIFFSFNFLISTTTTLASQHTVVIDIQNDLPNNTLGDLAITCDFLSHNEKGAYYHINVGAH
jgi:hypothetical protein